MTELIRVDSTHNPAAMGPEGEPYDWYTVRAVFRVHGAGAHSAAGHRGGRRLDRRGALVHPG